MNATTVRYHDLDGDKVTITSSVPIFNVSTVNSVLKFSIGGSAAGGQ